MTALPIDGRKPSMEFPIRQVGDHRPNKQVLLTGQHCRIPICRSRAVSGPYINRVVRSSVIAPGVHYFRRNQVSAAPTKTETAHLSRNTMLWISHIRLSDK